MAKPLKIKKPLTGKQLAKMSVADIRRLLPADGLYNGGHQTPGTEYNADGELCLMEAVAYVTGEPHSDNPRCACPVLTEMGVGFNDSHNDGDHDYDDLMGAIPALVGSRTQSRMVRRKRAVEAVKILRDLAAKKADDYVDGDLCRALTTAMLDMDLVSKRDIERVLDLLVILNNGFSDHTVEAAVSATENLADAWKSDGISKKKYAQVVGCLIDNDIIDGGAAQADVIRRIGTIRG